LKQPAALIIEDDPHLANIFSKALQAAGFETEIVSDGAAALAKLTGVQPDMVVLDLHLPNVSGKDILLKIKNDHRLAQTKVILVTADALLAESLRTISDLILIKPIGFHQLRDQAKRLLSPAASASVPVK